MALTNIRRLAVATALSVISIGTVATAAHATPCDQGPGGESPTCVTVVQSAPAQGAALSGTITLSAHATQATPGRGNITHVEWWLYSPTFKAQHPGNAESKVLLSELINAAPATGTLTDGTWNSSWTVQSGSITARDGDYATPGLRTYTLPTTGTAAFQIETHVLDAQWDADNPAPGGPPGRSGKKDVTINFTGAPPAPPPPSTGPCGNPGHCITVTPVAPSSGATLSGNATLTSNAVQTIASRGAITHVEWWLLHPSFVTPANDDGRVLIASSVAPSSGTATNGTWTSTWAVPTGSSMTTQNDGAGGSCPCTVTLPATGQYTIETHVLDLQWDNSNPSPGQAPGRSAGVPVTLPLQVPTPPPPPPPPPVVTPPVVTPPVVTPPVVTPPVVIVPKAAVRIGAAINPIATRQLRRGAAGAVIGTITTFRQRRNIPTRGLRVTFQRWDGKHWISLSTVVSAPNGTVILRVRPRGTTTYRLVFAGNATFAPARSKAVQIKVV